MSKILFMLLFCLVPMPSPSIARTSDPVFSPRCPYPRLAHGRARPRQRGRMVRFVCDPYYELVGHRYATCREDGWDESMPICIRPSPNCREPPIDNGVVIPTRRDAWLMFFCMPQYKLVGSPALYCDGSSWNGTAPTCVRETSEVQLSCNFEDENLCGWRQDDAHDFDWRRHNMKTPSSFAFTGPSYDHTFGNTSAGYYMYIESSSRSNNDTARLISPMFSGNLTQDGCFSIFYHMYGRSIGGLRVYQIPETSQQVVQLSEVEKQDHLLFEKWGNLGDTWFRNVSTLRNTNSSFQIVIEGIRGASFTSDIAIDDVQILQGDQCVNANSMAVTPPEFRSESCSGRCDVSGPSSPDPGCGCSLACAGDGSCCPDFIELCIFSMSTSTDDDDDDSTVPPSTTPATTTTTARPTRPTPRPTARPTPPVTKATNATIPPTPRTTQPPRPPITTKPRPNTTTKVIPTTKPITTTTRKSTTTTKKSTTTTKLPTKAPLRSTPSKRIDDFEGKPQIKQSSGSKAVLVTLLVLVACLAGVGAVAARSARGRAALARLRARRAGDTEVRFLTRDDD